MERTKVGHFTTILVSFHSDHRSAPLPVCLNSSPRPSWVWCLWRSDAWRLLRFFLTEIIRHLRKHSFLVGALPDYMEMQPSMIESPPPAPRSWPHLIWNKSSYYWIRTPFSKTNASGRSLRRAAALVQNRYRTSRLSLGHRTHWSDEEKPQQTVPQRFPFSHHLWQLFLLLFFFI